MAYTDKKVHELRNMCLARGLATSGTKPVLISRLEKLEQQLQGENFIKQEENEMQIDMPVIKQQQEIVSSPHVSEAGPSHETLSNIKYECEHTNDLSQSMATDEVPVEELYLPQQSLERHDMPPNVDMSNEYPQSIDPVEQQQQKIDHPPTESPVATSSIVTHDDVSAVEVSSSTNDFEQNKHDQPKPFDSSEKSYTTYQRDDSHYEIDRELLARLISERKNGTQHLMSPKMFSRGIMMNQGQANGVPYNYNYDLLLDIVQKSEIYKDGEIPDWLRYDYDTTFGTTYYGEPECVRDIGIPVEELFSNY